jgi:pimeloyl-ACP methyl ester carboxylesterase
MDVKRTSDQSYMAGARRFPTFVPVFHDEPEVEESRAAWKVPEQFDQPFMYAFSGHDLVTAGGDKFFIKKVPSCNGVEHLAFSPAGHFLQQDRPSYMLPPPWICRIGFEALAVRFLSIISSQNTRCYFRPLEAFK